MEHKETTNPAVATTYPYLKERIYAMVIDSILIIIMMFIFYGLFGNDEDAGDTTRMIAFVFTYTLEPMCVAFLGGSLGHYIMGIRVKQQANEHKNINILLALVRSVVKILLGILSLLWMNISNKNRALHDKLVGSVVIYKS